MPKKIATEKWKNRKKLSSGPGYFQTSLGFKCNRKSDNHPKKARGKLPVISNGQASLVHYSLNIHQMSTLFESDDPIVGKVRNVVQFLLSHGIDTAKYYWLQKSVA